MPELVHGGVVRLWAGWSVELPPSHHRRNDDGSWSAWGNDWAIDVQIIEVGSAPNGAPASPQELLGDEKPTSHSGFGWIGTSEVLKENDGDREVFRLSAKLATINTMMLFWVSFLNAQQLQFACDLVNAVTHSAAAPATR